MANNASLKGTLNSNDQVVKADAFGGLATDNVRFDEYLVSVDQDGASITLETNNTNTILDAPNLKNGAEFIAGGAPITVPALPTGTKSIRVVVGQSTAGTQDYTLTARTDKGNVTLASLGVAATTAPSTGANISLNGTLATGDSFVPVSATGYSLVDEYIVKPTISGDVKIEVSGATGTGFTPNLQIISAAGVLENVGAASATKSLTANESTRVRVINNGAALGGDASAQYKLAFAATSGSLSVVPIGKQAGGGQVSHNTPTLAPAPAPIASDTASYLRYNKGEQGSFGKPDPAKPANQYNFVTLSTGDDKIDLGNIPANLATVLTDLQAGLNPDGSSNSAARWIVGFDGNDEITGTAGNDAPIAGNAGNDKCKMGAGADVVVAGQGSDDVDGEDGDDVLSGNKGNDLVKGGLGKDFLIGGQDDDILNGGEGKDSLRGDAGRDFLTGGTDADKFILVNNDVNAAASADLADVLTDFAPGQSDTIEIQGVTNFEALTLEGVDLLIDGALSTNATALKVTATGKYLGVVKDVSPFDLAERSNLFTFA